MFLSPRIALRPLGQLCHRLAMALGAGIDVRKVFKREAENARGAARAKLEGISQEINAGRSLGEAIKATDDFFPLLFRELVAVGEETGQSAEVFSQLASHYDHQLQLKRDFLAAITLPLIQLFAAIGVIGMLIWIMGFIGEGKIDPLGFGLIGDRGVVVYFLFVGWAAAAVVLVIFAFRRGVFWIRPIQRLMLHVPVLGPALQTLALSQVAWTWHLTFNTSMGARRAVALGLLSTNNAKFLADIPIVDRALTTGCSIYDAFREVDGYPYEFLESLSVAEQSGRLVESMAQLSRQYQERARMAMTILTKLAAMAIWVAIASLIIFFIFRLFMFYIGAIEDAAAM